MNKSHKLVKVYQAAGELEALAIKSKLESFGIPAMLRSNAASSVHVFSVDGMGAMDVMVIESDRELAEQLISNRNEDV